MGTQLPPSEGDFNALQFEKTLTTLKDSQESINNCCQWCLQHRIHHKKIVNCWLNVLKRVKVEQRLILFYLANDVVQYSKRKNYEYVESWGTALQKATTLVRDEKVKHKILRIFKIWEQRGVYGEEFISDLCGLISIQPTGTKNDEQPHEFQASYVINKIKNCAHLEKDTDVKLKMLKEHNPKIQITEGLINSLKDRAHVDDVEKEVDVYVQHMESYINALKLEIKNRIALISILKQSETQLESDRKDVKLVAHAYKTFGQRVKTLQKKLEERIESLPSPIPSPDINAPSPSPDSDLELPDENSKVNTSNNHLTDNSNNIPGLQYNNASYYNPVTGNIHNTSVNNSISDTNISFLSNGFTSFLGQNLSFDLQNISTTSLFPSFTETSSSADNTLTTNSYTTVASATSQLPPPLPAEATPNAVYNPLLPPPMPPFTKSSEVGYGSLSFGSGNEGNTSNYGTGYQDTSYSEPAYTTDTAMSAGVTVPTTAYDYQVQTGTNPYPPSPEYDPSEVPTTWENVENPPWNDMKDTDTPESPPMFEKEGYEDPVEYHDGNMQSGASDVDHRVLPGMGDIEDSLSSLGGKDVDHRNLISLTGSPNQGPVISGNSPLTELQERSVLKTITPQDEVIWDSGGDRDYRSLQPPLPKSKTSSANPLPPPPLPTVAQRNLDQDYRLQFGLDLPPPPPPPKSPLRNANVSSSSPPSEQRHARTGKSPRKGDNVDNVDMDLSDEDMRAAGLLEGHYLLEPPPPLPDLLDDVDANQFLDEISNDLNEFSNLTTEMEVPFNDSASETNNMWQSGAPDMAGRPNMVPPPGMVRPPGPPPGLPPMGFDMGPPHCSIGELDNRMERSPLLPNPMMNGPPMMEQFPSSMMDNFGQAMPPQMAWMESQQPPNWAQQGGPPPFEQFDENPNGFGGFRGNRGGAMNFRGGFNKDGNFNGGFNRGRGWGGNRGSPRGGMRGRGVRSRGGGGPFRPRGFRGR